MQNILEDLKQGVLLFDGATGTCAKQMPDWPEGPVEAACLSAPDKVKKLHTAYIDAGCRAIKTNTFAAHPGLAATDEIHQREMIRAAVSLAAEAAGDSAYVFADIGPAPADMDAASAYITMSDCFLQEGVSCFLFETFAATDGLREAAAHIKKQNPEAYVITSFAANPDGFTRAGECVSALIAQMDECAAVDAVGLNCVCGAYHMRRLIESMTKPSKCLIAMPNAGYPHIVDGRIHYDSEPEYYARQVVACVSAGAGMIGGCCGTRPEHIRQISRMIRRRSFQSHAVKEICAQDERVCRSEILNKLNDGRRVILVELDPPKDAGIDAFLCGARAIAEAGADAITIADCPIGRARMDSSLLACKIKRELGIEAMPHMTCRDRNVNATKALLLGLSMEGVHNVLAVTGDPVPSCDRENVKSVFQFNSRVLARFVRSLSEGRDAEPFFLCGALNINAVNFASELERAKDKELCGMQAFLTQPVLSEQAAINLEQARRVLRGKLIGGIFPVVSEKNARFLQSEVAGITLDSRITEAFSGLDREEGEQLAVRLCRDAAKRISPFVDGFYIMTPFQRVNLVCTVIQSIQKL